MESDCKPVIQTRAELEDQCYASLLHDYNNLIEVIKAAKLTLRCTVCRDENFVWSMIVGKYEEQDYILCNNKKCREDLPEWVNDRAKLKKRKKQEEFDAMQKSIEDHRKMMYGMTPDEIDNYWKAM
jgi:hypothetical protein